MDTCVHVDVGFEGEPWVYYRVAPASGSPIKNQLVISDRPSLYTTDIAVVEGSINTPQPSRPIIEVREESKNSILKPRSRGGKISTAPTGEEHRILGLVVFVEDETIHEHDPFFKSVSTRWELRGVSGGRGDLVREARSSGPRTVIDDWGDTGPALRSRGWGTDGQGEESGQDE